MIIMKKNKPGRPTGTSTGGARPLTSAEIKRLKAVSKAGVRGDRNHAFVSFLLGTGARVSEPLQLTVADIAPEGRVLACVALDKHQTKSRRSRKLHLSKTAQRELQAYLDKHLDLDATEAEAAASYSIGALALSSPLFPSCKGKEMNSNYASQLVLNLLAAASIHNASAHSFRATFATELVKNAVGLSHIQHLLGHKSLQTTQRYLTSTDADLSQAVASLAF